MRSESSDSSRCWLRALAAITTATAARPHTRAVFLEWSFFSILPARSDGLPDGTQSSIKIHHLCSCLFLLLFFLQGNNTPLLVFLGCSHLESWINDDVDTILKTIVDLGADLNVYHHMVRRRAAPPHLALLVLEAEEQKDLPLRRCFGAMLLVCPVAS